MVRRDVLAQPPAELAASRRVASLEGAQARGELLRIVACKAELGLEQLVEDGVRGADLLVNNMRARGTGSSSRIRSPTPSASTSSPSVSRCSRSSGVRVGPWTVSRASVAATAWTISRRPFAGE